MTADPDRDQSIPNKSTGENQVSPLIPLDQRASFIPAAAFFAATREQLCAWFPGLDRAASARAEGEGAA